MFLSKPSIKEKKYNKNIISTYLYCSLEHERKVNNDLQHCLIKDREKIEKVRSKV